MTSPESLKWFWNKDPSTDVPGKRWRTSYHVIPILNFIKVNQSTSWVEFFYLWWPQTFCLCWACRILAVRSAEPHPLALANGMNLIRWESQGHLHLIPLASLKFPTSSCHLILCHVTWHAQIPESIITLTYIRRAGQYLAKVKHSWRPGMTVTFLYRAQKSAKSSINSSMTSLYGENINYIQRRH